MTLPSSAVYRLAPYVNGKHNALIQEGGPKILKLDSNEATVAPSPRVLAAIVQTLQNGGLQHYPDVESQRLIEALAKYTGMPSNYLQTFNGSDHALETVCRTFLGAGDEVVMCMPAYDHFRLYAESTGATLVPVWGSSPFVAKIERLMAAVTPRTKIVYVVNPANPTGILYTTEEIQALLHKARHAVVIVDEAYFEFSGVSMQHLVEEFPNLIVARSFSKAFGLAGLRAGYLIIHPELLQWVNKVRVGKNVNTLAQVGATKALEDCAYMEQYVAEVIEARNWITQKIRSLGLKVVEAPANYILVNVADPKGLIAYLEDQQVFIRDRSHIPQLNGMVRITVGNLFTMERFWSVFKMVPKEILLGSLPMRQRVEV